MKFDVPETFSILQPGVSLRHASPRKLASSLESFQKHMDTEHTPLIFTDCITQWPALDSWKSPSYLLKRTLNGSRLVPIELGESYVADSWTQKLVPFSSFLQDHLLKESIPRGYLAQHDLLTQIPSLRNDILVPDYCYTIPPENPPDNPKVGYIETDDVTMNIWLGPSGTRSPLHNDPYENIFAQVVGYKYFRLYPPGMTEKLYPRGVEGGIQMGNTSQVNLC
jgi:lysine-specific demethylase 8